MQLINCLQLKISQLLLFCSIIPSIIQAQGQQDFNRYTTLLATGSVPEDFTVTTAQKVKQSMLTYESKLSPTKKRIFLEGIYYNIDEILHSGSVIYGDEITLYVEAVAQNLLQNDPELRGKLRFYTIKSNTANALSTGQGIIFITTGLIAQLTSEAQLAYILSHEIAHYTEKHVSESFQLRQSKIRTSERIKTLSAHSREHEFEADKLGLKLYHAAGYDDDQIVSTFDVLMYSYLPFDEVAIAKNYFSSERFYIPDSFFSEKSYPIKADEDYDDDRSSHPNIRKRKDAVLEAMTAYDNWGSAINIQGINEFLYIRNLSRFESVRTDVLDGRYAQALYSIFLLEKEFPQSIYLDQMKAHVWLGIAQMKAIGKLNETFPASNDYEGESAALYYFLRKLNNEGTLALATRIIYDIQQLHPEDTVLAKIKESSIRVLAKTDKFSWSDYSDRNFHESAEAKIAANNAEEMTEETSAVPVQSKYDKIHSKKNVKSPESFDSTKFHLYGLADITADSLFRQKYTAYRTIRKEQEERLETSEVTKKKKKIDYALLPSIGLEKVLVLEPISSCYHAENGPIWKLKDRSGIMMGQSLDQAAEKNGIQLVKIQKGDFQFNPDGFNQRNTLYGLVEQLSVNPDAEFVPIDYYSLKNIETNTGTPNVLFNFSNYYYEAELDGFFFLYCIIFPPALLYVPFASAQSHHLETSVIVVDITTGRIHSAVFNEVHGQPSKDRYSKVYLPMLKSLSRPQ
jgi:predicted Zn-dependent protease